MTRFLILLASLVLVGPIYGQIDGDIKLISYPHQKEYVEWGITQYPESHVALAVSNNGWGSGSGSSVAVAKKWAIKGCKKHSRGRPCLVADIDFKNISPQLFKKYVGLKSNKPSAAVERDSINAQTNLDSLRVLTKLGRTQEQYEECYTTVHATNLMLEGRTFKNWQRVVKQAQGVNDDSVTAPLILKCKPFLSADYLTWTAPLPGELQEQFSQGNQVVTVSQATEQDCSLEFHKHGGLDWRRAVAANLADGPVDDIDLNRCKNFVSADYLTWTAPLPGELQEQFSQGNQVVTIPETTKTIDLPKIQSPEVVDFQPTEADKNIEIEFWRSIQGSDDTDMYREYLRQFPSGVYAGLAKLKIKKLGGDTTVVNASIPNLDYGDYYALVIGNNEYSGLSNLRSAVNDAKVVSTVLEVDYGFNVKLLENASRKDILRSLKHLRQTVSAKDNVLIYYAGHGYLDEAADQGYWLPVDSERDDDSNWIATDRVAGQIKAMQAKHVMVVADSCFSGTITRAIKIEQRTPEWLSEIVKKKARTALTSGGLEPVMDTGSGNHSAFAYAFISLLEENDGVLDASQLFSKLRPKVMVNSTQTPQYGKIHMAGDDGGDFLFVRR
jgi:hypothetical protein